MDASEVQAFLEDRRNDQAPQRLWTPYGSRSWKDSMTPPRAQLPLPEANWTGACALHTFTEAATARLRGLYGSNDFEVDLYSLQTAAVAKKIVIRAGSSVQWVGVLARYYGLPLMGAIPQVEHLELPDPDIAYALGVDVQSCKAVPLPFGKPTEKEFEDAMNYREELCSVLDSGPFVACLDIQSHYSRHRPRNEPYQRRPGGYVTQMQPNGMKARLGHCITLFACNCPGGDVRSLELEYQENMVGAPDDQPGRHLIDPDAIDEYFVPLVKKSVIAARPRPAHDLMVAPTLPKASVWDIIRSHLS